jgi:DNA-nicking Smr family endonuclease
MWPFHKKQRSVDRPEPSPPERDHTPPSAEDRPDPPERPFVVTDTLDLHGFFPRQVPEVMAGFLENAVSLGLRRLRVVHGKGRSRMKWEVHQVLMDHPAVERFTDAPPESGGWGATIVLLRDRERPA